MEEIGKDCMIDDIRPNDIILVFWEHSYDSDLDSRLGVGHKYSIFSLRVLKNNILYFILKKYKKYILPPVNIEELISM